MAEAPDNAIEIKSTKSKLNCVRFIDIVALVTQIHIITNGPSRPKYIKYTEHITYATHLF